MSTQKYVRLTDAAITDLERLHKKDPLIVRDVFAKMVLLERATDAGEPLIGALVGFRKLVVGNRSWRIVWREVTDENHDPILEVAEVWAAGAREDGEVYAEMVARVAEAKAAGHPQAQPLAEVVRRMGRLYSSTPVSDEPPPPSRVPDWLARGLREELHLPEDRIRTLSENEAHQLMIDHWTHKNR